MISKLLSKSHLSSNFIPGFLHHPLRIKKKPVHIKYKSFYRLLAHLTVLSYLYDLLFSEHNTSVFCIHLVNNRQRFQLESKIADHTSAGLESLLDHDSDSFYRRPC